MMATNAARPNPPRLRVAEGGLGPLPEWLADTLVPDGIDAARPPGCVVITLAEVATRLRLPTPWRYRRIVLEPVPYALEATACRALLDAAIGAATACLERPSTGVRGMP
jgi:hypothetical protein